MSVAAALAVGPAAPPLCLPPPRSPTSARPLLDGEPISPQGSLPSASWTPARLHVLFLLRLLAVGPPGALRYPCGRRRRPGHLDRPSGRSLAAAPGSRSLAAALGRRSVAATPGSRPWQPPLAADSGRRPLAAAARPTGCRCSAALAAVARPPWPSLPGHPGRSGPDAMANAARSPWPPQPGYPSRPPGCQLRSRRAASGCLPAPTRGRPPRPRRARRRLRRARPPWTTGSSRLVLPPWVQLG